MLMVEFNVFPGQNIHISSGAMVHGMNVLCNNKRTFPLQSPRLRVRLQPVLCVNFSYKVQKAPVSAFRSCLSALTLQGPLQRTATAHPATHIVAYFDDINVVGAATAAAPAFEALATQVRTVGLTPVPSKSACAACSPDQDMATAAAAELGIFLARESLVVAGTPIGTVQILFEFLAHKRQQVHAELQRLADLPHPLTCQDKWVILTRSLQLRLQHLSCAVPSATASPHLEQHADDLLGLHITVTKRPINVLIKTALILVITL
jgi:hypothetical protein